MTENLILTSLKPLKKRNTPTEPNRRILKKERVLLNPNRSKTVGVKVTLQMKKKIRSLRLSREKVKDKEIIV